MWDSLYKFTRVWLCEALQGIERYISFKMLSSSNLLNFLVSWKSKRPFKVNPQQQGSMGHELSPQTWTCAGSIKSCVIFFLFFFFFNEIEGLFHKAEENNIKVVETWECTDDSLNFGVIEEDSFFYGFFSQFQTHSMWLLNYVILGCHTLHFRILFVLEKWN
jgi:hypothetical protein